MRGGGGADGAIHRAGGPAILRDCVKRFPDGLATGDAGWTTAGDLPAQWVIHTVGPNYNTGQRDRSLLESCYRRALEVADELGARIIAFPLIGTGAFGWPRQDAIAAAIETIATVNTRVEEVRLVAFGSEIHEQVLMHLASSTPIRILQGVQVLHQRGYHRLRILPGVSPSGMYWRVAITVSDNLIDDVDYPHVVNLDTALQLETRQQFVARINRNAQLQEDGRSGAATTSARWLLGERQRHLGSLHQDEWHGTGSELAHCNSVAVYPAGGWWKNNRRQDRIDVPVRYSLILSLRTPEQGVDLYTPIATQLRIPIETEVTTE